MVAVQKSGQKRRLMVPKLFRSVGQSLRNRQKRVREIGLFSTPI